MNDCGVFPIGYCALEYKAHDEAPSASLDNVIAIVQRSELDAFHIRVRPNWQLVVEPEDYPVLQSLFDDFKQRAKDNLDDLFRHISDLGIGPLVTYDAGKDLANCPELLALFHRFIEI